MGTSGCTKRASGPLLVVEIPASFSGNFLLEMGVKEAPPLEKQGDSYVVAVPGSGKVATSTMLSRPLIKFKNDSDGTVWGFSQATFKTGDGIAVGGKIEFFVGTRKQYDAEENKKNHSGGFSTAGHLAASIV
jgi:hypothetical protein